MQGYNVPYAGLVTFGEAYHGNHHAFPGSAKLALDQGQVDPGWWFIQGLAWLGLVRHIETPESVGNREGLRRIADDAHRPALRDDKHAVRQTAH